MYSLEDLKKLWEKYEESNCFSLLKDGVWAHTILDHNKKITPGGTSCRMQKTSKVMDFIEFLESING